MAGRFFHISTILVIFCAFLCAPRPAGAIDIFVDDNAPLDPAPGDPTESDPSEDGSISHPFDAVQEAIDAAGTNDIVIIADGTYTGVGNRDISFLGKAITIRSANGPENCIIDCQGTSTRPHRGFIFYSSESSNSILDGLTITNGYSDGNGGGIFCQESSPAIRNCIIQSNQAKNLGGGIACTLNSFPIIFNCTLTDNYSKIKGGGIGVFKNCYPIISYCTITNNSTEYGGGGILCYESDITINQCAIGGNKADYGGGIYFDISDATVIKNCTIRNNAAETYGGGICLYGSDSSTITNCLINGNQAAAGGGLCNLNSDSTILTHCTLAGNTAPNGTAIACDSIGYPSRLEAANCIFWDGGNEIFQSASSTVTITYSDVEGGWTGQGNIEVDPLFINPLSIDPNNVDYHLRLDSPCIDAGTNDPPAGLPATDIEGNPRPIDGDLDGEAIADMGAYEIYPFTGPVIEVSTWQVEFTAFAGEVNPPDESITIRNGGSGILNWQISPDCSWLAADPCEGSSCGEINEIILSVDISGLSRGIHHCNLTISDPCAVNSPQIVDVRLQISILGEIHVPDEYTTIQLAINAAQDGDEVIVADGTYTGMGNRDLDFKGKAITVRSENGPQDCIINCQGSAGERHRGFYFNGVIYSYTEATVDGFTIKNGFAFEGGGIYCLNFNPNIINCIFTNNRAISNGGGLYGGAISNCTINGNQAEVNGGGICGGIISNCTITNNRADGDGGGISGGIISNCTITNNRADGNGGGVLGGTISDCTVSGNVAGFDGGGIYGESVNVNNCTISDNVAGNEGGGIYSYWSKIYNCTIKTNSAFKGGGIRFLGYSDYHRITNCIITGNNAELGAAIAYYRTSMDIPPIINCTVNGNIAFSQGGALYCDSYSNPKIYNCIFWDNSPHEIYYTNYKPLIYYSDIQRGWEWQGSNGNIVAD
ncbi:MAG: hypothetical protein AMJ79_12490, partial [Phycisphaerae bacterium SM23_30]